MSDARVRIRKWAATLKEFERKHDVRDILRKFGR